DIPINPTAHSVRCRSFNPGRDPGNAAALSTSVMTEVELELSSDVITLRPPGLNVLTIAEAAADLLKYGKFMDDLRIYVKGGTGGMGYARLGGAGGKGGDVWLVADEKMTLKKMKDKYPKKRFVAEAGTNSSIAALKGNKGKDCEVNVPPGIIVTTENGKQLGKLDKIGERLLVALGGIGGCPVTNFLPTKGQTHMIHLDLKLIADVGLIGFEMQKEVTTLSPEIGTVMYPDHKQITVADLPGLIEGAHANKGRGHKFLKHVERTKQLLFVIDVSGFQLSSHTPFRTAFETIMLLAKLYYMSGVKYFQKMYFVCKLYLKELELYKEELQTKSALLAVNKMDLPNAKENFEKLMEQLQKPQNYLHLLPQKMIPEVTVKFREIIPISAHTGEGSEQLSTCLRKIIDQEAEEKIESYQREQLHALHLSKI
ncbi:hypothetical protein E2320_001696, partial [Naja naja]